ncbi:MAG TPA: helix-turn-helix domain-containing protein [Deltaproteobacteria bacterium]|nr:helix-turn-helix domain-containing protein [Deltaproteobacteria bacterium]HPR54279.1 helix-turn-helix domain-containing protein [Deltaproteobacteria bacterium]HXK45809.1 helix-turn-helix domain-containing protein [Deltaproteobacteria bacterium]
MGFKEIGKKIQQAREERGLTQVELAQSLGITQAGLSNYELGKRRLYLHQIEQIAETLGKGLDFFIGAEDAAPRVPPEEDTPLRDRIISRIRELNEEDLRGLTDYLDFLTWRNHHD